MDAESMVALRNVDIESIKRYLVYHGWEHRTFPRVQELLYYHPEYLMFMVIPSRKDLNDYLERVEQTIRSISKLEDRSVDDIVRELNRIGAN